MISPAMLMAYSGQILVLIATAILSLKMLRLQSPRTRLILLQAVWFCCVALPWLEKTVATPDKQSQITVVIGNFSAAAGSSTWNGYPVPRWLVAFLCAVAVLRLFRLFWNLRGLRNLRKHGTLITVDMPRHSRNIRVYLSDQVAGPATYGFIRPVILLPAHLRNNRAVLRHELIHVHRRDWAWHMAEQAGQCLLWFHPAVWWLSAEIDLAREQVVDAETVAADSSGSISEYIQTLLEVALRRAEQSSIPVSAFGNKSSLRRRITMLIQQQKESRGRLILSTAVFTACTAVAAWQSARALPFPSTDHPKDTDTSQTKENDQTKPPIRVPGETQEKAVTKKVNPIYPKDAKIAGIQGTVELDITISKEGLVESVKPLSGPAELIQSSVDAVKQWEFRPTLLNGEPIEVVSEVVVNYTLAR